MRGGGGESRFYVWIDGGEVRAAWRAIPVDCATDCTDMGDDEFERAMDELTESLRSKP